MNGTWVPPKDLDLECLELCVAMNKLSGVWTTSSCCGHGKNTYCIFFRVKGLRYLPRLLYWMDACHSGVHGWKVEVYTDCSMCPAHFVLEGPVGDYEGAKKIAKAIEDDLERSNAGKRNSTNVTRTSNRRRNGVAPRSDGQSGAAVYPTFAQSDVGAARKG